MNSAGQTAVDEFFGDRGWRIAYQESQSQGEPNLHWRLIEFYKSRLQALGYKENSHFAAQESDSTTTGRVLYSAHEN
jgi:hypothetical protein